MGTTMGTTPLSQLFTPENAQTTRKHSAIITITECFLAGALGLEPRAYGFGDDAGEPASGGNSLKCVFQTYPRMKQSRSPQNRP